MDAARSASSASQGTLCYTTSPVHGTETFLEMAKTLVAMDCDTLATKGMAGLLTPEASCELVRALKQTVDLPIHFHSHATSGLAQMCQLKAEDRTDNGAVGPNPRPPPSPCAESHGIRARLAPDSSCIARFRYL